MISIFIFGRWKTLEDHIFTAQRCTEAQITVAIGIPLIYLWFAGIPPGSDAATFGVLTFSCLA
jgi:hypothetical protein